MPAKAGCAASLPAGLGGNPGGRVPRDGGDALSRFRNVAARCRPLKSISAGAEPPGWFVSRSMGTSVCLGPCVRWGVPPCATLWTVACQAPLSTGFSRQEDWSGLPFPSPKPQDYTEFAHFPNCVTEFTIFCPSNLNVSFFHP